MPVIPAYQAITQTNHNRWCINTIRSAANEQLMLETFETHTIQLLAQSLYWPSYSTSYTVKRSFIN